MDNCHHFAGTFFLQKRRNRKNRDPIIETPTPKTPYPLSGHYVWTFEIPGVGEQESHLVFYTDSIGYIMVGPAYSTNYMMIQESYTDTNGEMRWIGVGKGGVSQKKENILFSSLRTLQIQLSQFTNVNAQVEKKKLKILYIPSQMPLQIMVGKCVY